MSYNIIPTPYFKKEAKRLFKRYASLKEDLRHLAARLTEEPLSGISLGNNTYKIRLAIKSKGKGKSSGARVITYIINENREVYLLSIYDKSEIDSINDKAVKKLIEVLFNT